MSAQVEKNTNQSSNANKRPNPVSNTSSAKDNKPKPKEDSNESASNKNQAAKKDLKKQETQNDAKKDDAKSNKTDDKQNNEKKTPNKANDKGSDDKKKPVTGSTEKKDKDSPPEAAPNKKKLDEKKNQETENAKEAESKQDKSSEKDTKASSAKDKGNVKEKEKDTKETHAKDAKDKANVKENAKDKSSVKENAKDKEVKEESKKEKEHEKLNDTKDNLKETKKLNDSKTEKSHVENGVEEASSDTKSKTKEPLPSPGVKAKIKDSPSAEPKHAVNAKPSQPETNEVEPEHKVQSKKEKDESNSTGAFNKEVHKISPRGKTRGRNTPTTPEQANVTPLGKRALNEESSFHYSFSTSPRKSSLLDDVKSTPLDVEFTSPSLRECFNSSAHRISGRRSLRSVTRDISFQPTYNQSYRKRTPEFEATISSLNATRGSDSVISTSFSFVNRAGVKRPQSESSVESSDKQSECETKPKRPRLDFGGWLSFVTSPVAKLYGCFRKNQYNVVTDDGDAKSATIEDVSSVEHAEVMEISHNNEEEQDVKEALDESLEDTIIDDEEDLSLLKNQSDDDDFKDLVKEKHQIETDTQIVADAATTRRNCSVM